MELSQEHFDKTIAALKATLVTKEDLENGINELAKLIDETVATPMQNHFNWHKQQADMSREVAELQGQMKIILKALNITNKDFAV